MQHNSTPMATEVPIPLCELQACHETSAEGVQALFKELAAATMEAATLKRLDGNDAPSLEDLQTELGWLFLDACCLEDAVSRDWQAIGRHELSWLQGEGPMPLHLLPWRLRASVDELAALWTRRLQERTPLQYLTHTAHWRDVVLAVGPSVLIPRPETELLIDFAESALRRDARLAARPWVDLGTGSGALACGLARLKGGPGSVHAVDLSPTAAATARTNARRLGLEHSVHVVQGSWAQPVLPDLAGACGGVVSNPPYIPSHCLPELQAEVARHEPWLALDGGVGAALDCFEPIVQGASALLAPGGFLALESGGAEQAASVASLLERTGAFSDVHIRPDLAGKDRFILATRTHTDND